MKKIFISFLIAILSVSFSMAEGPTNKILAIIASKNFNDEELFVPKEIFEKSGFKMVIASSSLRTSRSMLGTKVTPDIMLEAVNVNEYDAIIFVGGPGAVEYWNNPVAHKIAQDAVKKYKVLAAICIAPVTLANAGVLFKKKATVYSPEVNKLIRMDAFYTGAAVEVDGSIITANGPSAASAFAQAIMDKLEK